MNELDKLSEQLLSLETQVSDSISEVNKLTRNLLILEELILKLKFINNELKETLRGRNTKV